EDILGVISNQYNGAPLTMVETLPLGASVLPNNISVWRDGVNLGLTPTLGLDAQRRRTITLNIVPGNYNSQTDPNTQTFEVRIRDVQYNGTGCFDADQNCDLNSNMFPLPAERPSKVTWTFPASGRDSVTKYMPCAKLCVSTQYSGDIYGTSIIDYAFPGIDVSVARTANSSARAVWSLADYNFSATSFSSYLGFKEQMDKVKIKLMKRSKELSAGDFRKIFSENNPNSDIHPDGEVYYVDAPSGVNINLSSININQRATAIIDGNLTISAGQIKKIKESNNVLLLVFGEVRITGDVSELDLGIVAPEGVITIENANKNLKIKGFLIAQRVQLRSVNAALQSINYDPSFTFYPPPGLSSMLLPIFKEVKP
ncbi:hypothetical protein KJ713_01545, partial [Patescibacteria group bacterium]|nr:hypothetical protein [Patescibacteria group bacterium]